MRKPTLYLVSHQTGNLSIVYWGFWCAFTQTHLFHRSLPLLSLALGNLSVPKQKKKRNVDYLRNKFLNKEILHLVIFGSKSGNSERFGKGGYF
jgi:hypothetical protein